MSAARPSLVMIAGPNSAGKSTVAPVLLKDTLAVTEFVNADVIARGISAFAPENVAVAAGRLMLGRLRELAEQRTSFAFETTLASRSFALWIRRHGKQTSTVLDATLWEQVQREANRGA